MILSQKIIFIIYLLVLFLKASFMFGKKPAIYYDSRNDLLTGRYVDIRLYASKNFEGLDINLIDRSRNVALFYASENGDLTTVESLIAAAVDINATDQFGHTALHKASENGHFKIVRFLIKNGAKVNIIDEDRQTALHKASENGHFKIVRFLIKNGAKVNIMDEYRQTALHKASKKGHLKTIRLLIDEGANFNFTDIKGMTAFHYALLNGDFFSVKILINYGANFNAPNGFQENPLLSSLIRSHIDIAILLINKGVDITVTGRNGDTALHLASKRGYLKIVRSCL